MCSVTAEQIQPESATRNSEPWKGSQLRRIGLVLSGDGFRATLFHPSLIADFRTDRVRFSLPDIASLIEHSDCHECKSIIVATQFSHAVPT